MKIASSKLWQIWRDHDIIKTIIPVNRKENFKCKKKMYLTRDFSTLHSIHVKQTKPKACKAMQNTHRSRSIAMQFDSVSLHCLYNTRMTHHFHGQCSVI